MAGGRGRSRWESSRSSSTSPTWSTTCQTQIKLYLHTRSVTSSLPLTNHLSPTASRALVWLRRQNPSIFANVAGLTDVTDDAWRQAKLPYNLGGLQLQDPSLTADAAYLGPFLVWTSPHYADVGPPPNQNDGINLLLIDADAETVVDRYNAAAGTDYDVRAFPTRLAQKDLASLFTNYEYDSLYTLSSPESKARIQSSAGLQASAIYLAVPNHFFGTKVTNHLFEKIVQFRLGNVNGSTHCSYCGHLNDANGIHQTTSLKLSTRK